MLKIILSFLIFYTFSTSSALAYIDPGTGSIILHAILAFIATCFAWVVAKYKAIKLFIKNKFYKKK
tara:strand:+ start:1328 stop:1525 length:198 start_codon:yes stop_codon:yes gene_type:complete